MEQNHKPAEFFFQVGWNNTDQPGLRGQGRRVVEDVFVDGDHLAAEGHSHAVFLAGVILQVYADISLLDQIHLFGNNDGDYLFKDTQEGFFHSDEESAVLLESGP